MTQKMFSERLREMIASSGVAEQEGLYCPHCGCLLDRVRWDFTRSLEGTETFILGADGGYYRWTVEEEPKGFERSFSAVCGHCHKVLPRPLNEKIERLMAI